MKCIAIIHIVKNLFIYARKQDISYFSLTIFLNVIFLLFKSIGIYKSNPDYFIENLFQVDNIIFSCTIIVATILLRSKLKLYILFSIIFIVDILFNSKDLLQSFIISKNYFKEIFFIHITLTVILGFMIAVIVILVKKNYYKPLVLFLFIYYSINLITVTFSKPLTIIKKFSIAFNIEHISKNFYFLLFDEYPSEEVYSKYYENSDAHIRNQLIDNHFISENKIYSNFTNTEGSTLALFTGTLNNPININKTIKALNENVFTERKNYSFYPISIFDNNNRPSSLVTIQFFQGFNSLSTRYIIPYVYSKLSKRGIGNFTKYEDYHAEAIMQLNDISLKTEKHIVYIHFYTPHMFPLVENDRFDERMKNANLWMRKAISIVSKNDPLAGIIIFSDHGLRLPNIPKELWNRNILFYKNARIDTVLIRKEGLVSLFKAVDYNFY